MVVRAIELDTHESGVVFSHNDVAESILQIGFPKPSAWMLTDEVDDDIKVFILDHDKGRMNASIDRRETCIQLERVGEMVNGSTLVAVGLGDHTNQ